MSLIKIMMGGARWEVARSIAKDVAEAGILKGTVTVSRYDPEYGKIEIVAETFGKACPYLLTDHGAFMYGNETQPVTRPTALETCQKLMGVVARHNPQLAGKLAVSQPG